ncbi:putative metalloprotease CJM1_0395 family protein [Vampirovibrio sp.]|uniref:putative metalloprotease CJM1_0395 family protein n=1 Tax=Vampirovibrio sp. TaxID=2717857 RepID=UPI0035941AA6
MGISFSGGLFSTQPFLGKANRNATPSSPPDAPASAAAVPDYAAVGCCGGSHGLDFNHKNIMVQGGNPAAEFERFKSRQYADILSHEQAHQSAAGSLGGGVHIQFDGNGVAVSGHVPIAIPGLDPQNPENSYNNYSTVRRAALAPGDPSGQDCAVASQAQALMGQAQVLMAQKKQAQSAGLSLEEFQKLNGKPLAGKKASS